MFGSLGWPEMLTLLVVALLIFGPDKLPSVVKDAAGMLRTVRNMAKDARSQLKTELGPEFSDFDLDSLNPRSFVRKNLFEDDDDPPATRPAQSQRPAGKVNGEQVPYDPDTI
ncbi:MAG TPA: sec-independent translocase [Mycobacteriales bacterium]